MDNTLVKEYIWGSFRDSIKAKQAMLENENILLSMHKISAKIVESLNNGGKVLIAGNGGSAADAQHVAGEFINRFNFDRPGLPCIALTTDTSVLTAVGNDYAFERVFQKQVEALGKAGDVFIGITTSGDSPNILEAMKLCREKCIATVGLTGQKAGKIDEFCDYMVKVPSSETPRVQESHILVEHIICGIVEASIFNRNFK
jgi:D-sedoheptulose 7-phosphate isomerase